MLAVFYRHFLGCTCTQEFVDYRVLITVFWLGPMVSSTLPNIRQRRNHSVLRAFTVWCQLCIETLKYKVSTNNHVHLFFFFWLLHFPTFFYFHESKLIQKLSSSWFAYVWKPRNRFWICNQFLHRIRINFLQALSKLLICDIPYDWV